MSEFFSTDLVRASDRLDAWLFNATPICGDCRFHFPKRLPFHGSIERKTLAGLAFTRFSSAPVSFAKFPMVSADASDRDALVITQLEGVRRYCQSGVIAMLAPGDTTLIDAGQPWTSDCIHTCSRLYLRIPRWRIQEHTRRTELPLLPRIIGKRGLGATLFRLALSLYQEAEQMTMDEGSTALDAYLGIIGSCLARPEASSTKLDHCTQLRPRIELYIDAHLAERELTPTAIAAAEGISVRHLHRVFAANGCTVAEWVRERRLEHCRCDLANSYLSHRSITEIALSWGFSDSAHFSHCFRNEFGISPSKFRSHALNCRQSGDTRHSFAKFPSTADFSSEAARN